ncbi:hypothetical protein HaLaN_02058 [Haematococcus lacustris]|uniref:Kazal-like domain-containing protein n=1 Tax=Haematococcus lacustris TaxID=44745 RepID=A0A699YJV8_HAELA|nr:hypothetical protein HaLaN_02058 [Haematococcus lacustris]
MTWRAGCGCSDMAWQPVCAEGNLAWYPSLCHARCQGELQLVRPCAALATLPDASDPERQSATQDQSAVALDETVDELDCYVYA